MNRLRAEANDRRVENNRRKAAGVPLLPEIIINEDKKDASPVEISILEDKGEPITPIDIGVEI